MGGIKNDKDKPDWSLIDPMFIEPLVAVFAIGEKKYGYENWKKKFENGDRRFKAALMRHYIKCYKSPLAFNEEDNCYHLAQVAFNALLRLYHALNEKDDRLTDQYASEEERDYYYKLIDAGIKKGIDNERML